MTKDKKEDDPREIAMGCVLLALLAWGAWSWLMSSSDGADTAEAAAPSAPFEPGWRGNPAQKYVVVFPNVESRVAVAVLESTGGLSQAELLRQMAEVGIDTVPSSRRFSPTGRYEELPAMIEVEIVPVDGGARAVRWVELSALAYDHAEDGAPWTWDSIDAFVDETGGGAGPVRRAQSAPADGRPEVKAWMVCEDVEGGIALAAPTPGIWITLRMARERGDHELERHVLENNQFVRFRAGETVLVETPVPEGGPVVVRVIDSGTDRYRFFMRRQDVISAEEFLAPKPGGGWGSPDSEDSER